MSDEKDEICDFDPSKIVIEKEEEEEFDINSAKIVHDIYIDPIYNEYDFFGFDLVLLEKDKLYVNLIYFDTNINNGENYKYYNYFKVDVVGEFQAIDNLGLLERYLETIKIQEIPFIVISSGSSGKDVIQICQKYSFVKEIIIFCRNYEYNKHYLNEYPDYVKKVLTSIKDIYKYIKSFDSDKSDFSKRKLDQFVFSYKQIKMNKQLELCPVISAYEYDNYYYLIHRAYAHFFGKMEDKKSLPVFDYSHFNKISEYLHYSKIIEKAGKNNLYEEFRSLGRVNNFIESAIRLYTGESMFRYIFNLSMRYFEDYSIFLAYYMGPFLYGVNKYVYENPDKFAFRKHMTLYRNIQCSFLDFYFYKINLKHIICLPSITSTSTLKDTFNPIEYERRINKNNGIPPEDIYKITMIFHYKHEKGNISPGIIIKDNIAKDGKYLSSLKNENEVILYPFTFVRITDIKEIKKEKNQYEIHLDIINRKSYIEYTLRDDVKNRILFGKLD